MNAKTLARLKLAAKPGCPDCDGEGLVSISWNNNPDRCEDVACACIYRRVVLGDCPLCDGYVLNVEDGGLCPSHAREQREAQSSTAEHA